MVLMSAHLHLDALSQKRTVSEKLKSPALAYGRRRTEGIEVGPEMPSLPSLEGPSSSDCQTAQSTSLPVFVSHGPQLVARAGSHSHGLWFRASPACSGSGDAGCVMPLKTDLFPAPGSFQEHFHLALYAIGLCLMRILLFPLIKELFHVCAFAHVCMHVCGCVGATVYK